MKYKHFFIMIMTLIFWGANYSHAKSTSFEPKKKSWYRIENQFSGKIITGYQGALYLNSYSNNGQIRYWAFEETSTPGIFAIRNLQGSGYIYSPENIGSSAGFNSSVQKPRSKEFKWNIQKVIFPGDRDVGLYTLQNVKSGLYLKHQVNMESPNLRGLKPGENSKLVMEELKKDRTFYWAIEPMIDEPVEALSIPQGGWPPNALNKCAVLSSNKDLGTTISYLLTGTPRPIKGKAYRWGKFWNEQYFYIINLNHRALRTPGTYTLKINDQEAQVHIAHQAYTHPYRQKGTDRFSIAEIFDNQFGFVGHWAHNMNWWPQGTNSMPVSEFGWRDWGDNNKNEINWENFEPSRPISFEQGQAAYSGGWDMTDQEWHEWAKDGEILRELTLFYLQSENEKKLRAEIVEEIFYGVRGVLANQEENGSWRQGVVEGSYWLGTSSQLGGGLAAAHAVVQEYDPALGEEVLAATQRAWNYVYSRRNNAGEWPIPNQGILPDGTLLIHNPQGHRHGYLAEFLEFAVEVYLLTQNSEAKGFIDDVLSRGALNEKGQIYHTSGEPFPGEQTLRASIRALIGLIKYYDVASEAQKKTIREWCRSYYESHIIRSDDLDGPFGMFEGYIYRSQTGGQWQMPPRMLLSALMYDQFGEEFAQGILIGQRVIDYWSGCNPYATSLLFGVGDEFQVSGWSSYHALGRHVGLISAKYKSMNLASSTGSYMSKETTCAGNVQLWLAWTFFEKHLSSINPVYFFSDKNYKGYHMALGVGTYSAKQLSACGVPPSSISSIKIPEELRVTLYKEDAFKGEKVSPPKSVANLRSWDGQIQSIKISLKETSTP